MRCVIECPQNGRALARPFQLLLNAAGEMTAAAFKERPLPSLYTSHVRYQPEPDLPPGQPITEFFDSPYTCWIRGYGDCDDLVIWRMAELIAAGIPAHARILRLKGTSRYHCQVTLDDGSGTIEDPCLQRLGKPYRQTDNHLRYTR